MKKLKPELLYVMHCYNNRAGVEEHIKVLSSELEDRYRISIVFPEQGRVWLLRQGEKPLSFPGEQIPITAPYQAIQCQTSLAKIIDIVQPDIIHIVHIVKWPLGIIDQLLATAKPTIMSFHDYYLITPIWTMQDQNAAETTSPEYAIKFFGSDISEYLNKRRQILQNSLSKVDQLIVPSLYLKNQLERIFPFEYQIIPYGIKPFEVNTKVNDRNKLRFGYLGSLLPQKGWEYLLKAFLNTQSILSNAELHFYGGNINLPPSVENVYSYGVYSQEALPQILGNIDVGIIPSIFAETYSIVLSEMWQAKIVAAVSNIGAMGERVVDRVNGRKFEPADIESLSSVLSWFVENDQWRKWQTPQPILANQMALDYDRIYQDALKTDGN